jgi:hypothetical protein
VATSRAHHARHQPAALKANDTLAEVERSRRPAEKLLGGVRAAAGFLLLPSAQAQIMESMHDASAELTQQILDEMFVFGSDVHGRSRHSNDAARSAIESLIGIGSVRICATDLQSMSSARARCCARTSTRRGR